MFFTRVHVARIGDRSFLFVSWEFSGANFGDGSPSIGPFMTHYGLMGAQVESLNRRLPLQLVAYHIHLRLLHSGLTAEQVLALPNAEFGLFVGQCCEINRDAGLVPYQRDGALALQISGSGTLTLGLRDTEDMVSLSRLFPQISLLADVVRVPACWVAGTSVWGSSVHG
jgi:hypothetical protein